MANRDRLTRAAGWLALIVVALSAAACAGPQDLTLQQARDAYEYARLDPQVGSNAPVALHEAEQALTQAEQADDPDEVDHLANIAKQRVAIARAEAQRKLAKAEAQQLLERRD